MADNRFIAASLRIFFSFAIWTTKQDEKQWWVELISGHPILWLPLCHSVLVLCVCVVALGLQLHQHFLKSLPRLAWRSYQFFGFVLWTEKNHQIAARHNVNTRLTFKMIG